jgi:hypothetical protein
MNPDDKRDVWGRFRVTLAADWTDAAVASFVESTGATNVKVNVLEAEVTLESRRSILRPNKSDRHSRCHVCKVHAAQPLPSGLWATRHHDGQHLRVLLGQPGRSLYACRLPPLRQPAQRQRTSEIRRLLSPAP